MREYKTAEAKRAEFGLRNFARYHGQRIGTISDYQRQRQIRLDNEANRTPSLPSVSILNTEHDLTEADFRLGKALQSAAGY